MFIITKTFTDDEGHLYTKVNPKQYSTPKEAYDAMREDYLNELKSRGLAAACAALAQEAIPYSLDCQRHILVDENHYFEAIDVFDDYDIDFDVIRNF